MSGFQGGCACGAVRYACTSKAVNAFHCQCRQCQHATGTGHSALIVACKDDLKVTGELHYYDQTADDGNTVSRSFCPVCGSPLLGTITEKPGIVLIAAGSLDDPDVFKPERVVWTESGQDWDYMDPTLPRT